jgi:hypothetical protein
MKMTKFKQKGYGTIEIDNSESDIVIISMTEQSRNGGGVEFNLIQITRELIPSLIKELERGQSND